MNTNMMELNMKAMNMNELSVNELEAVAGGMTRAEREAALAPDPNDNIVQKVLRAGLRKVVGGIDAVGELVEPLTSKCDGNDARTAARNIFKGAWNTIKSWF